MKLFQCLEWITCAASMFFVVIYLVLFYHLSRFNTTIKPVNATLVGHRNVAVVSSCESDEETLWSHFVSYQYNVENKTVITEILLHNDSNPEILQNEHQLWTTRTIYYNVCKFKYIKNCEISGISETIMLQWHYNAPGVFFLCFAIVCGNGFCVDVYVMLIKRKRKPDVVVIVYLNVSKMIKNKRSG